MFSCFHTSVNHDLLGFGDSFIGYGNEDVDKMYYGFFILFVSVISVVGHSIFLKIASLLLKFLCGGFICGSEFSIIE